MEESLQREFDEVFEGDEATSMILKLTSSSFTRHVEKVRIKDIGLTHPIKLGRKDTASGLTTTIKDLGVVTPIHIMTTEESESEDDEDIDDDNNGYKYVLLDGLRRLYGAMRNGQTEVDAVIWDFEDKEKGMDYALIISLILNRVQKRSWGETWDLYRILEMQHSLTPGVLEYLLQLEGGDAMKLKDVMLCEYEEVKEALMSNQKTLDASYKMLQKLRKEENQLEKDDVTGIGDITEDAEDMAGNNADGIEGQLSDDDVRELLNMSTDLDNLDDVGEDDFDSMNTPDDSFVDQQKVGERHALPKELRDAVLQKDDFHCQCCNMHLIGARAGLSAVHHILPVHVGGKDKMENLTTLCVGCHITLHNMERNGGSIMMSREDFDALPETEQISLKKALKLARIAIEADKRKGLNKEAVLKATQDSIRHPMPGTGLKETQQSYKEYKAKQED